MDDKDTMGYKLSDRMERSQLGFNDFACCISGLNSYEYLIPLNLNVC